MQYLEYNFSLSPRTETATDVLTGLLADIGFESFMEQPDGTLSAYIPKASFLPSQLETALQAFPLPGTDITYTCTEPEDKDWNEEWEKNFFRPIVIEGRCVVHSTFHRDLPQAEYDIVINPQMAFGTGHHETTSLILEELLDADLTGKSVLDMGCGTSILAILARMRGADPVDAVDIDEWCVNNSLENIELNGVDHIQVRQGDASILAEMGPYDVVLANINRNILLADMRQYVARMNPGATLLMSGFYEEDVPLIRAEGEQLGLTFVHQSFMHLLSYSLLYYIWIFSKHSPASDCKHSPPCSRPHTAHGRTGATSSSSRPPAQEKRWPISCPSPRNSPRTLPTCKPSSSLPRGNWRSRPPPSTARWVLYRRPSAYTADAPLWTNTAACATSVLL